MHLSIFFLLSRQHHSVDGDSSLHSSSFPSSVSTVQSSVASSSSVAAAQVSLGAPQASSVGSATMSGLGPVSSMAMGLNTASIAAAAAAAAIASATSTIPSSATSSRSSVASG